MWRVEWQSYRQLVNITWFHLHKTFKMCSNRSIVFEDEKNRTISKQRRTEGRHESDTVKERGDWKRMMKDHGMGSRASWLYPQNPIEPWIHYSTLYNQCLTSTMVLTKGHLIILKGCPTCRPARKEFILFSIVLCRIIHCDRKNVYKKISINQFSLCISPPRNLSLQQTSLFYRIK